MNPTTNTTNTERTATTLKARLDDLRVRAHLGGMEAHDKLEALAHQIDTLGRKATRATKDAAHALHEKLDQLEKLLIRD